MKNRIIDVQNVKITVSKEELDDYICITDIAKAKTGESRSADVVKNWLRKMCIRDRNLSGTTWNGERTSCNYRRTYHRLPYVIPGRCNRW